MTYQTIVADPPWPQKGAGPLTGRMGFGEAKGASRKMPYPTMSVDEIAALQVPSADDAVLYLWTTSRFLRDAYDVADAWGFNYSTTLVWAKTPMGGGLGGVFYGIQTEFILFCRRGQPLPKMRISQNWFNWKRPYDKRGKPNHSAKPPEFFTMVEATSRGPYLELFARKKRSGWHSWGNEVPNDIEIAA